MRKQEPEELVGLVRQARAGSHRAFETLMERHQNAMFALAYARLGDFHKAEDAAQEAFIEAFLFLEHLETPEAFPTWLRRIVQGKCVRQVRGTKSIRPVATIEDAFDLLSTVALPEQELERREAWQELQTALDALLEGERSAIVLFALGEYPYSEIASLLQIPIGTVKKRIHTARQRLRQALPEQAGNTEKRIAQYRPSVAHSLVTSLPNSQKVTPTVRAKPMKIELLGPEEDYKSIIKNLYTFYRYDLMPFLEEGAGSFVNQFGVLNGETSRTHEEGVEGEEIWWQRPEKLRAYLIQAEGRPAGFVMVASPPYATAGVNYRLNELFVLNKVRRHGVASEAMRLLFDQLPGKWELAYLPNNEAAMHFWQRFIPEYTEGHCEEALIGMGQGAPSLPGYIFDNSGVGIEE